MSEFVRAAGGIVLRDIADGREVLLVHRPRYDDWSFPKGKCHGAESDGDCALREVEEETGLSCDLGAEVGLTSYHDSRGRPKIVRYWAMRPLGGSFEPHSEVDEIRWLAVADAPTLLSHDRDRVLLDSLSHWV